MAMIPDKIPSTPPEQDHLLTLLTRMELDLMDLRIENNQLSRLWNENFGISGMFCKDKSDRCPWRTRRRSSLDDLILILLSATRMWRTRRRS